MSKGFVTVSILVLAAAGTAGTLFEMSSHSTLAFHPQPKAVGVSTPIAVHVSNPHGIRRIIASIEQNGARTILIEARKPATRFHFWGKRAPDQDFAFSAGKNQAPGLQDGPATIVFEAQSNDFRGATDRIMAAVQVSLRPPFISGDAFQHYINQGGSGMALMTPTGSWTEAGVRVGDHDYPSFPVPGDPNQRFALFAYPWNTPDGTAPMLYAKNAAGTLAKSGFAFKIFPKKFRARDLAIDDSFLNKVVNQIDPNGSGDLLARFLKINGEMRRENNKTLADLRFKTEHKFLWTQSFLQLANSKVESEFADVRSYIYKGKKVDQQVHLGFDLAVGQHTPVVAANDGKVVWAKPLGIYGNCIVVDHGYGLQSIYGHLSQIDVKEGEMVKRGQAMGKSGSTGLAGGDHLHFSMQLDGVQVNPIEWWDQHWIQDHIRSRIAIGS